MSTSVRGFSRTAYGHLLPQVVRLLFQSFKRQFVLYRESGGLPLKLKSSDINIKNLVKKFGDTIALEDINIDIQEGEFFALLGPSGCGKTTTMRAIAGFETTTSGEIYMGDELINN